VTRDADATRALRALFADDATTLPDRVLDAVLAELPVTRQQRRTWRLPTFTTRAFAVAGVAAVAVVLAFGLVRLPAIVVIGPAATPTLSPAVTSSPSASPGAAATSIPIPSAAVVDGMLDTAALGNAFTLRVRMPVPDGWFTLLPETLAPPRTFNLLNGDPNDDTTWWGPQFNLVDGAMVRDPAKTVDPLDPKSAFVPWPASFLDYIQAIPGVQVLDGPTPVTVGGIEGRAITVTTPPMAPTIWLKDDSGWLGGGSRGVDPAMGRYYVELNVRGTPLLIEYDDDSAKILGRLRQVQAVLAEVQFPG
jgi:hypothetical protein